MAVAGDDFMGGSFASSLGGSTDFDDSNLSLSDRLKPFKSSQFGPDAFMALTCQYMTEKEIKHMCNYLIDLKRASAEEMRKSVYANYGAFIRTSKEITVLEGQLLSMRNLLSSQSALVHHLAEGVNFDSFFADNEDSMNEEISSSDNHEINQIESWLTIFLDNLEVFSAERRVDETLSALDRGEAMLKEAHNLSSTALLSLRTAITEKRQKLADQLAEATQQPSASGSELRSAVLALKKLGDSPRAHTLLLHSHHQKLQCNMPSLRKTSSSSGGSFIANLSKLVFSTIAQAARDSIAVFGEEPAYSSELVTWAVKETDGFARLLKKQILDSAAAAGGLRVVTEVVNICLGHSTLLEARGLSLSPVLLRYFRPLVEQALIAYLKRIEQSTSALAAADDWSLTYPPAGSRAISSTAALNSSSQPKLSSSAHRLNSMVQELLEDVGPLESMQLSGLALEGALQVFDSYMNLLIDALSGSTEHEEEVTVRKIVRMAETEAQQVGLLANASLLADELLPRAALRLLPMSQANRIEMTPRRASDRQNRFPEQREWKRKLQRLVDQLRDSFCRTHALELIFTEDGEIRLNAHIYLNMDDNTEEPEWFPSPIFQELFDKLTRMASIAADMFVGRKRFATILLMRMTETVILWLSEEHSFWVEIEEGQKTLGPLGLQQFYLDMEFVMIFSSQGRYLSRHLQQVIKNIIARAIDAVTATGIDPYSVLPEDDWFAEVAQIAIKMLSGKANFTNVDRDVTSPTASETMVSGGGE